MFHDGEARMLSGEVSMLVDGCGPAARQMDQQTRMSHSDIIVFVCICFPGFTAKALISFIVWLFLRPFDYSAGTRQVIRPCELRMFMSPFFLSAIVSDLLFLFLFLFVISLVP